MKRTPGRVLLKTRRGSDPAVNIMMKVRAFFAERGVETADIESTEERDVRGFDAAIGIGGDGTLLRLFRSVRGQVPMLGVKDGSYGLLMELSEEDLMDGLEMFSRGEFYVEEAPTLMLRDGDDLALNEILLSTPEMGKAMKMRVLADEIVINGFLGDGILISTPLGSLAYALAEGGPSIDPRIGAFEVVPLNPWPPSMLVPTNAQLIPQDVGLRVESDKDMISVMDGRERFEAGKVAEIVVSKERAKLIRFSPDPTSFYTRALGRISEARKIAESKFLRE